MALVKLAIALTSCRVNFETFESAVWFWYSSVLVPMQTNCKTHFWIIDLDAFCCSHPDVNLTNLPRGAHSDLWSLIFSLKTWTGSVECDATLVQAQGCRRAAFLEVRIALIFQTLCAIGCPEDLIGFFRAVHTDVRGQIGSAVLRKSTIRGKCWVSPCLSLFSRRSWSSFVQLPPAYNGDCSALLRLPWRLQCTLRRIHRGLQRLDAHLTDLNRNMLSLRL